MDPILEPEHRELEEALLRAGREVGMSADLQAKTLAALGIATAGVALTSTAKASAWSSLTGKTGAVWGGVVGLVGVGGAVIAAVVSQGPDPSHSAPNPARPQVVAVQERSPAAPSSDQGKGTTQPGAVAATVPEVAADDLAAEVSVEESSAPSRRDTRSDSRSGGDSRASVLREELSHISKVEAALRAGAQGEALSLLAVYRSRFARPKLGLEAEVLTIQALYESGSVAAAQQRARSFLQRYPKSPLGARAKRYLRE